MLTWEYFLSVGYYLKWDECPVLWSRLAPESFTEELQYMGVGVPYKPMVRRNNYKVFVLGSAGNNTDRIPGGVHVGYEGTILPSARGVGNVCSSQIS